MSPASRSQASVASLGDIIHSAINLARLCLSMDVAFITEFKNGQRIFRHVANNAEFVPVKIGDSFPLEDSYCHYVVNGTIPPAVDDSHLYPILKALDVTEAMRIRAYLGVPIRLSDGSVFGTFCCYSHKPSSRLRDVDVEAMRRFAALIATMLEQRVVAEREREAAAERVSGLLATGGLRMVYQPIVDIATGRIAGAEALARFDGEPVRGPDKWFEEAHAVALGTELELFAAEHAVADLDRLPQGAYLALNVSPHTILSGKLDGILARSPAQRLVLEVTEHAPIEEYEALAAALVPLRQAGLRLAIDDAGSGYASFRHILQLRPDIIKLDQSLIRDIDLDDGRRALALALVTFARETGSTVVAEGVEAERELAVLRTLGVDMVQGYLLGHPLPAA